MPELTQTGPEGLSEEVLMTQRPPELNAMIRDLLQNGTAEDLKTERGKMLRLSFTPFEAEALQYMRVKGCPNYDGVCCDNCRGDIRFVQCPECHGTFDQNVQAWPKEQVSCSQFHVVDDPPPPPKPGFLSRLFRRA
jgi:hypothetical protein